MLTTGAIGVVVAILHVMLSLVMLAWYAYAILIRR